MTTFQLIRPVSNRPISLFFALLFFKNFAAAQVFAPSQIIAPAAGMVSAHAIDFNGDGRRDLLTVSAGTTFWYQNFGGGQFAPPVAVPAVSLGSLNGTILEVVDFDSDGDEDLVAVQNDFIFWQENLDGKGSFGARIAIGTVAKTARLWIADLDFDGDLDILPAGGFGTKTFDHFLNGGDNKVFVRKTTAVQEPAGFNLTVCRPFIDYMNVGKIGFLDVYRDGNLDAFTFNNFFWNSNEISILSDGNGGFGSGLTCTGGISGYDSGTYMKGLVDINGDGYSDLIGLNYYSSSVTGDTKCTLRYMASGVQTPPLNGLNFSLQWKDIAVTKTDFDPPTNQPTYSSFTPIDLENDGDVDILTLLGRQISVHLNNGSGSFSTFNAFDTTTFLPQTLNVPFEKKSSDQDFIIADLDNDGFDDVACFEAGNLVWFKNQFHGKGFANVNGKVFFDKNQNGLREADETDLFFQKVNILPSNAKNTSLTSPEYDLLAFTDDKVSVSCQPMANWKLTTASPVEFFISKDTAILHDFGVAGKSSFAAAEVRLTSSSTRCDWEVPFWLSIRNTGTQTASGKITVPLSPLTQFLSASPAPAAVLGNVLIFNLQDLPPTHEAKFQLILKIADASHVGEQIKIFPKIELTDAGGAVVFSGESNFESVVRCSFDPNDKLISPNQGWDSIFTVKNREIEYTIRFQNTGNDTAFDVKILDRLHPHLDWTSFRPISSSHPFTFDLARDGSLTFLFEKINLPDSAANPLGSQGFVRFGIRPRAGLTVNSKILNHAKIIFDKNPPITTNVVRSFVRETRFVASLVQPECPTDATGSIRVLDAYGEGDRFEFRWAGFSEKSNWLQGLPSGRYPLQIIEKETGTIVFDQEILLLAKNDVDAKPKILHTTPGQAAGEINLFPAPSWPPPGVTFRWNTDPPQTSYKINTLEAGTYQCTLTFPGGCTKVYTFVIEILVGTGEAAEPFSKFEIVPNPTAGAFQIRLEMEQPEAGDIQIFNALGILEKEISLSQNEGREQQILVEGLPGGVHFVGLRLGDERWFLRRVLVLKN